MDKAMAKAVIEWDTVTWARAVDFWKAPECTPFKDNGRLVLDVGGRGGGLSLMFALLGYRVCCTDLGNPSETAGPLHRQYGVEDLITYRTLDVLDLDEKEKYDIICFKSVMGGVGHHNHYDAQQKMIENIYRALKPGGYLYFAENTTASPLHRFLRGRFSPWAAYWRYVTPEEVHELCRPFSQVRYKSFGFLGTLGRSERQRRLLGSVDRIFDCFLPAGLKYCISVVAKK